MKSEIIDRSRGPHSRQAVLKVETVDGPVVVKRYGVRRGRLRQALKQIGHWTFAGKSAASPAGRRRTEAVCLALWRHHGFDVFGFVSPAEDLGIAGPHLVLEYVEGRTLYDLLEDPAEPEAAKRAWLRRFAPEWGRRHATALRLGEPRLLHEHGTFRHVFVAGDRLITFDLEIAWVGPGRTARLVGREITSFLRSLGRASGPARFGPRLEAVLDAYPDPSLLLDSLREAARARGPLRRVARRLEEWQRRRDAFSAARVCTWVERIAGR